MSAAQPAVVHGQLRRDLLAWLLLALLGTVAIVAAGFAVLDAGAVNWGYLSLVLIAAVVGFALIAYGLRDSSASELSLIAALAALATAGRVLFASLPNFKPVTFIVLVSGVALGTGSRLHGGRHDGRGLQPVLRSGAVDSLADAGLGLRRRRGWAHGDQRKAGGPAAGSS